MRPAFSVIFFTVMSGCGYGLLFLFGLALAFNPAVSGRIEGLVQLGVGAIFVVAGLLASTLHLGQPQRAWRAFSQWRSSWLSREGVASVASFMPMVLIAGCLWRGADATTLRALGALLAAFAAITVICTAGIYTSLKAIPAWHNRFVLPGYLLMALLGGAAWSWLIGEWTGGARAQPALIVALAIASCVLKHFYWRHIDAATPASTIETATGLGRFGRVRSVEAPHTEENYLTHEMGFQLARKHGKRLRNIALLLLGPCTIVLALLAITFQAPLHWPAACCAFAAAILVTAGLFVERWLFFAQAKHVVMLYYGGARMHDA
ncbi:MAG: dimethyl sulfoxide reductase anchor subunit [Proteobacteria bacterium]|nr:dimethyl sulfoxide reductase anchor subunit [Pseudomonadota bacterium]